MKPRSLMFAGILALFGCDDASPQAAPVSEDARLDLQLCSFNVRYEGSHDHGWRAWPNRIHRVTRTIREIDPDLLGVQEALHGQVADLRASLADYDFFGQGRDDGRQAGEYAGIFWKSWRFDRLDAGTFWLSDTPDVAGSKSWGNEVVRCASWAKLRDRATGQRILAMNTHWDHRHQGSRERAARLIATRLDELRGEGDKVVVFGDFNAVEENPALAYLLGERVRLADREAEPWPGGLVDPYGALHPGEPDRRTFHHWRGEREGPWKIDHILVSPDLVPIAAGIHHADSVFEEPSDHFPVWAEIAYDPVDPADRPTRDDAS